MTKFDNTHQTRKIEENDSMYITASTTAAILEARQAQQSIQELQASIQQLQQSIVTLDRSANSAIASRSGGRVFCGENGTGHYCHSPGDSTGYYRHRPRNSTGHHRHRPGNSTSRHHHRVGNSSCHNHYGASVTAPTITITALETADASTITAVVTAPATTITALKPSPAVTVTAVGEAPPPAATVTASAVVATATVTSFATVTETVTIDNVSPKRVSPSSLTMVSPVESDATGPDQSSDSQPSVDSGTSNTPVNAVAIYVSATKSELHDGFLEDRKRFETI
ncbi:hypothetical protein GQ53DRAFT_763830 [Thozetella sp. PMI_491]|nr:hypothetical protein GQ53DRAFT_763830 [Thozetella sp. PMI_491]